MKKFNKLLGKHRVAFWVTFGIAAALIIASCLVPPLFVIDSSVIAASGELAGFYALYLVGEAIIKGSDVSVSKGDVSVTINNPDNGEENVLHN